MCKVLKMPCTWYGSQTGANSTPCLAVTLVATFLLPYRRTSTIWTLFQHQSDVSPEIVAPALSTSASTSSRFWRCSITKPRTPGCPSTTSSLCWLIGPCTPTSWTNDSAIDPSRALSIFRDSLTYADAEFAAPCTSLVGRYMPWVVWKAL